jgi:hypothetical protein
MDPVEQRIFVKFLFPKGLGYKTAHIKLCSVLGEPIDSLSQTNRWVRRLKDGDLSCEDEEWSERLLSDFPNGIRWQLEKFPFMSTKALPKHFSTSVPTISRTLKTHLGLQNSQKYGYLMS